MSLLAVEGLTVRFGASRVGGPRVASRVDRGETVALVGESGSGKSLTALSHPAPAAAGAANVRRVVLDGADVASARRDTLRGHARPASPAWCSRSR